MFIFATRKLGGFFVLTLMIFSSKVHSATWDIIPSIILVENFTDNLFLTSEEFQVKDYVTEINPGIAVQGTGRRINLSFDYTWQNLNYRKNDQYNRTYNQLDLKAESELVRDNLFFDVFGRIDQQTISAADSTPVDNVNVGNRTDVRTLRFSPYLLSNFSNKVISDIRYSYGMVSIQEGASDSITNQFSVSLASGPELTRFIWNLNYDVTEENRIDTEDDVRFENAFAEASYRIVNRLFVLANFGYANNDFTTSETINNGTYKSFGLGWQPNSKFRINALYSNEYKAANALWNPTPRTYLNVGWRDTDVGLNTGEVWSGEFGINLRKTQWAAYYQVDTITTQQINLDANTQDSSSTALDQTVEGGTFGFGVTDEVFTRNLARFSVKYDKAKSTAVARLFSEDRNFQESGIEQRFYGGIASWGWRITAKTSFSLYGGAERRDLGVDEIIDNFKFAAMGLDWRFRKLSSASLSYRYTDLDSNEENRNYTENRVMLRLNLIFIYRQSM